MPNYQDRLNTVFQALADGNRRTMIDHLSKGDLSVSDLSAPLGISLPATLQHLSVLEAAGLVQSRKLGRVRTCSLDRSALSQAEKWINERRRFWDSKLDALGDFLSSSESPSFKDES